MVSVSPHDRKYRPPFPTLTIALRSSDRGLSTDTLSALVDTGADITSVPVRLLGAIEAPEVDEVRLRSHWGHAISVITYLVDVVIGDSVLPALEVVGDSTNNEIVLGRDVINQLILLVDGPFANTSVLDKRPPVTGRRSS